MADMSTRTRDLAPGVPPVNGAASGRRARLSADLVAPGLLFAFSAWVGVEAHGLGYWSSLGPGPGFFPLWIAVLLMVLAVAWATQVALRADSASDSVRTSPSAQRPDDDGAPAEALTAEDGLHAEPAPRAEPRRVAGLLVGLLFVALAMETLGYQLTLVIFLVLTMRFIDRASWRLTLLVALLAGPAVYHLFADLLAVQLPLSTLPALRNIGL